MDRLVVTRLFAGTPFDREPTCERCGNPDAECTCPPPAKEWRPACEQTAAVRVEKRKRGKVVTAVSGLSPEESELPTLLGDLKSHCGCGGTVKDGQVEIQGEHAERVREFLTGRGYRVR